MSQKTDNLAVIVLEAVAIGAMGMGEGAILREHVPEPPKAVF
jgi:hypothetical protein